MEDCHVDRVARSLATDEGTRRAALRLLAGGVLGALAARLGLTDVTAAKPKRKKAKAKPKRKRQAEHAARGQLRAEGKRKGKKRHKTPKEPPLPPGCQHCTECQMCQGGACVPDPDLNGVRCLGSAAACGYCQGGSCAASDRQPCPDGVCPPHGKCCPSERQCVDPESTPGWSCIDPETMCCPDERRCRDDCIPRDTCCEVDQPQCGPCEALFCNRHGVWVCSKQCCPGQKDCGGGVCVAEAACCPDETPCGDGSCAAPGQCCPDLYRCADGTCVDPFEECCPDQKTCGLGECVAPDECCPGERRCGTSACLTPPPCASQCGDVVCEAGELVCRPRNNGQACGGPGTACCQGRCYTTACSPPSNGKPRHFNPTTCGCECDAVESCPPGKGWSHATCSCVCNCVGRCCLSGCCKHPGPYGSTYCCQGY